MNEQLLGYLFDDKPHNLIMPMKNWINLSPRFKAFANTYRDKIRKKIRVTQSHTGVKDLEVELEIAYWLLQEQRFAISYEPYSSEKTRGPDFAVTFKSMTFNVEVTRMSFRETEQLLSPTPSDATSPLPDPQLVGSRLMDTVCDKLGQMRPGMVNVLIVVINNNFARMLDINRVMVQLRERAERKEASLFGRYGFVHTADFFKYYLRLSGVVIRAPDDQDGATRSILWVNNQAKHAMPNPIQTIFQR